MSGPKEMSPLQLILPFAPAHLLPALLSPCRSCSGLWAAAWTSAPGLASWPLMARDNGKAQAGDLRQGGKGGGSFSPTPCFQGPILTGHQSYWSFLWPFSPSCCWSHWVLQCPWPLICTLSLKAFSFKPGVSKLWRRSQMPTVQSLFVKTVWLEHSHSHHPSFRCCLRPVVTRLLWSAKPKASAIWTFTEKNCWTWANHLW